MIDTIRKHPLIGLGTCSSIEERWDDEDLLVELRRQMITTPAAAVEHFLNMEERHLERGLNQRWGEDNDPELVTWKEWKEKRAKLGNIGNIDFTRFYTTIPDKVRVVAALEKKPDLDFSSEDMMPLEVPQFEDGK